MKVQDAALDPEQLRAAMRAWTSGVTVVTAAHGSEQHGMTVSSFTSVSLEPPLIIISLQDSTRTRDLVYHAQAFGVTILAENQQSISDLFAGRGPEAGSRLTGIETETLVTGSPLIKGGLVSFDCRVKQSMDVGPNTLFVGEVVAMSGSGAGQPLVYHNRKYYKLAE